MVSHILREILTVDLFKFNLKLMLDPQEILELKRLIATPSEEKPHFNWVKIVDTLGAHSDVNMFNVALEIGEALTNICLTRGESDIFTESNKNLVTDLLKSIALETLKYETQSLNKDAINSIIEEVLVRNGASDIARSFVLKKHLEYDIYSNVQRCKHYIKLIRRNKQVVPWNESKIERAVIQAFAAVNQDASPASEISEKVTENIINSGLSFVYIEDVQDAVQEELMRAGFFKVAEAYILYRAQRAQMRRDIIDEEQDNVTEEKYQESIILINENDGSTSLWDVSDLQARISFARDGIDSHLTNNEVVAALREGIYNEISRQEFQDKIIENARGLIEKDPEFAIFAARIQLLYLYEKIFNWHCVKDDISALSTREAEIFIEYINKSVKLGLLHPKMLNYDLQKLANVLDVSADLKFDAIALQSLVENYLMRNDEQEILETPQMLWMRVAMGVFLSKESCSEDDVIALYNLLKNRQFCLSTPTLYYAGTPKAQMCASYVYHVNDNLESIMSRGIADNAFISKWGGGVGGSWSNIRGRGTRIKGTRGDSPGIIPFLQLHQHQLAVANQGTERRRGRGIATLEIWHCDVQEFIDFKKKNSFVGSYNEELGTVLWIPNLFMKCLGENGDWTLFNPEDACNLHDLYGDKFEALYVELEKKAANGEIFSKKLSAQELWQKIMQRIFETGYPKIAFKDTSNYANMCKNGVIHSPNLCLEHMLNSDIDETAVCNTGSLDISKHLLPDGSLDYESLRNTVRVAVRALDTIVDGNFYPTDASKKFAQKYRAIGLGVMGFQNALYHKNLPFDSKEAFSFSNECFEFIAFETISESVELAKKFGKCPICDQTEWSLGKLPMDFSSKKFQTTLNWDSLRENLKKFGIRNVYLNAISPTRKISRLMGCYPGLTPATRNVFIKKLSDNHEMMIISQELVTTLKKYSCWNKEIHKQIRYFEGELAAIDEIPDNIKNLYSTAFMINWDVLIEHAAIVQHWIDQSQSLRLFLSAPNLHVLSTMFINAWKSGIKSINDVKSAGFMLGKKNRENDEGMDGTSVMLNVLDKFRSYNFLG